jgi:hypothetical protein
VRVAAALGRVLCCEGVEERVLYCHFIVGALQNTRLSLRAAQRDERHYARRENGCSHSSQEHDAPSARLYFMDKMRQKEQRKGVEE